MIQEPNKRLDLIDKALKDLNVEIDSLKLHRKIIVKQLDIKEAKWDLLDSDIIDSIAILTGMSIWDIQDNISKGKSYELVIQSLRAFKKMYCENIANELCKEVEALDEVTIMKNCLEEIESELKDLRHSPIENADRIGELVVEAADLRQRIKIG